MERRVLFHTHLSAGSFCLRGMHSSHYLALTPHLSSYK